MSVAPTGRPVARRGGGRAPTTQAGTRFAFTVIILFVLAQVGWWLIFQERYVSEVSRERLESWQRDAVTATQALRLADGDATLRAALAERYTHLTFDGEGFVVDPAARDEFLAGQRGYIRMFAFEVPFFLLVVLFGLVFIARSLRSERELKRRQQNFMSAVTHEFKTPISTLRLLIETALLRPLPSDKAKEYLQRMEAEVSRLEHTSDQVLASARLEGSPEASLLAPHELGSLVRAGVEHLRQGLEARGALIRLVPAPRPLPVSVDEDAFTLALSNLLDNAVKYTPAALKPVTVRLEDGGDVALVHVEDEGIGIGGGEEQRIFERFYRSGDEMTRESPGMGLGLHLVRTTVEAMNGWVRCSNREGGVGAVFTIVLPLRVVADSEHPRAATEPRKA